MGIVGSVSVRFVGIGWPQAVFLLGFLVCRKTLCTAVCEFVVLLALARSLINWLILKIKKTELQNYSNKKSHIKWYKCYLTELSNNNKS